MHTAGLVQFLKVPADSAPRLGDSAEGTACSVTGVGTSGRKDLPGVEERQFFKVWRLKKEFPINDLD